MHLRLLLLLAVFYHPFHSSAQDIISFQDTIKWTKPASYQVSAYDYRKILHFENAQYDEKTDDLPWYISIRQFNTIQPSVAILENATYVPVNQSERECHLNKNLIKNDAVIECHTLWDRKKPLTQIRIFPFRLNNGQVEKLLSFSVRLSGNSSARTTQKLQKSAENSVLRTGNWYRIGVVNTGIYKMSYSSLAALGLNMQFDPRNLKVYGNGGRILPERNNEYYPDDLAENAIYISGESDGVFNENDFLLFYAQGNTTWKFDQIKSVFRHTKNMYADTSWYYITTDGNQGKRILPQAQSQNAANQQINVFDDYQVIENDEENLLKSGRKWLGNRMEIITNHSFTFSFPDIANQSHKLIANLAARNTTPKPSGQGGFMDTEMRLSINSNTFTQTIPGLTGIGYLDTYCRDNETVHTFESSSNTLNLVVNRQTSNSIAWIDYLILNVKRNLRYNSTPLAFRSIASVGTGNISNFQITGADDKLKIWEISNLYDIREQTSNINGGELQFVVATDSLREFVALNYAGAFPSPIPGGQVQNQNLHGTPSVDLVIVCPPSFLSAGNRIAEHHRTHDNMQVLLVTPQEIYNEFSSGKQDIAAIRNFMRHLYNRLDDKLKYLLLLGDGSYDPRYRLKYNTNFIPIYQSPESYSPIGSYASDDFFGLLDPTEGSNIGNASAGLLDIGIGRFPVSTPGEANAVVEKIIHYATSRECLNDWRNTICFISDDEDYADHLNQAEAVSALIDKKHPLYNIEKIYLDAYQQVSGSGGQRYPQVNTDITNRVTRGALMMNYAGHGGEQSLALERVITIPEINAWTNPNNLTFFMTATCEFSRFDDPGFTSAGEYVILNPSGAGVGLYTTTRLTFSTSNKALNLNVMDTIFGIKNNQHLRLGESLRIAKNKTGSSFNNRSFALLGDPAMKLAFPDYNVVTTHVNNKPVSQTPDTLKALQLVTISGYIENNGQVNTNFNGVIIPTVFDKPTNISTLSNDGLPGSPIVQFKVQRNIIYKGTATVKNGMFTFSFVVPQDIQYNFGLGKISYYARHESLIEDATGAFTNVIIGGFSNTPVSDDKGPELRLYMNNDRFVSGGMTDENPSLLAFVMDDIGINTVGTGIGHDITAILDANSSNPIILNDFYQADQDNYKKGTIRYPFRNLSEGRHTLTVKVWDVANNSSEATIEFIVVKSEGIVVEHLLNYPNPFSTQTNFFFEHNQPGVPLSVDLRVFTVSGKLVKTIQTSLFSNGYRSEPIPWDGRDDFGDRIAKGVYVYRLRVETSDGRYTEKFEKLVIL
ncbi:MAG: type IX secretion system sortase PorU [Bacteroidia bacterium]|nr:type IX secretion system sortase PorU [Bacteroidia bacterium]